MTFKDYPTWIMILAFIPMSIMYIWNIVKWPFKKLMKLKKSKGEE